MFAGRLIRGVRNGPSPDWLQKRLRAVGLRPINALVDITNFISLDRARPLHVFDADKLAGTVHARMGTEGETILALDGRTYDARPNHLRHRRRQRARSASAASSAARQPAAPDATTNVFIECAWFEPEIIAAPAASSGIVSDARYRFERTVDPEFVGPASSWRRNGHRSLRRRGLRDPSSPAMSRRRTPSSTFRLCEVAAPDRPQGRRPPRSRPSSPGSASAWRAPATAVKSPCPPGVRT